MTITTLTGCTSPAKDAVSDTANKFLAVVAGDSQEDINSYASTEVANGDFVKLFDSDLLKQQFLDESEGTELTEASKTKLDEFCNLFSDMITSYSVSEVEIPKEAPNTATCIATINTSFDVNVITSESATKSIETESTRYHINNAEEINSLREEDPDAAESKVYNDMVMLVLQIYEEEITESEPMTYVMVLSLEKNSETDSWIVTKIENYDDSSIGG